MLVPKRTKYRRHHKRRGCTKGKAQSGNRVSFGTYGLKAIEGGEINSRQIEAARRAATRAIKRGGKVWIRIFPHTPVTRKAAEVPMGSGKGSVDFYAAMIKAGTVLFEIDGVSEALAREAFRLAGHKLPVKVRFVSKFDT